jgi:predicted Fe-Mo cluster-binding NifX family protein
MQQRQFGGVIHSQYGQNKMSPLKNLTIATMKIGPKRSEETVDEKLRKSAMTGRTSDMNLNQSSQKASKRDIKKKNPKEMMYSTYTAGRAADNA